MKKTVLAILTAAVTVATGQAQILVAGWDFQTTTNGGTAAAAAPATPKIFTANFGTGTIYFDGSNGSSNWVTATSGNELTAFGGTAINNTAPDGTIMSSVTTSPAAIAVNGTSANNKIAVFSFSMASKSNLQISLTAQRTSSGFTSQSWEYSANGGTSWSSIGTLLGGTTAGTIRDSFANTGVLALPTVTGLDGISTALVRVTFTGSTGGNNRLDNIQFNAVPEPSSSMLMVLGVGGLIGIRSMRRKSS